VVVISLTSSLKHLITATASPLITIDDVGHWI
jgi:hypothetical protein